MTNALKNYFQGRPAVHRWCGEAPINLEHCDGV